MVHCWQEHFGKPGRARYHNHEWADKMEALGLMPSDTGEENGKRVGQRVRHYVIPKPCPTRWRVAAPLAEAGSGSPRPARTRRAPTSAAWRPTLAGRVTGPSARERCRSSLSLPPDGGAYLSAPSSATDRRPGASS